jgi:hypothetical protein
MSPTASAVGHGVIKMIKPRQGRQMLNVELLSTLSFYRH